MASSSQSSISPESHDPYEMSARKDPRVQISDMKGEHEADEQIGEGNDEPVDAHLSTNRDRYQMERMGKQQVLVRHFRPMATFSFNAMATCVYVNLRSGLRELLLTHFSVGSLASSASARELPTGGGQACSG